MLHVHHIDYNKFNCKENNLATTCMKCNVGANSNRDYWYGFYKHKVRESMEKSLTPNILRINSDFLKELTDYQAKVLVGKICKRVEIFKEEDTLKKSIRELIYESFRDFSYLVKTHGNGTEITIFDFKIKKDSLT